MPKEEWAQASERTCSKEIIGTINGRTGQHGVLDAQEGRSVHGPLYYDHDFFWVHPSKCHCTVYMFWVAHP